MAETIEERLRRLREQQAQQQGGQSIEERLAALRAQQPVEDSFTDRAYDALARGGRVFAQAARNLTGLGAAAGVPGASDVAQRLDAFMAERDAELAARRASRPRGGLATRAAETALEVAPVVAGGALLTPTSAGLPVAMAAGGAFGALTADWRNPQQAAIQTGIGVVAPPAAKAVGAGVRAAAQFLGRGAAAEATQGAGALLRTGAAVDAEAIRAASLPVNTAVVEAAQQVPQSIARKVADNIGAAYHLPRSLMASADISAPLRQGAIFTISNPKMAARATIEMFRAFKTENFEHIAQSIAADADSQLGQRVGLHLGSQIRDGIKRSEEAFLSRFAGKLPIVRQSENAYVAYLDTLRLAKFKQFKQLVDGAGLGPAQTKQGYEAAARWINYATGRGDFGATAEKMMPLLNTFFFAPKYAMSRLNILNPLYYAKTASTPGGRIILKQQAKELFAFASVVASTMALAKQAGAEVSFNPNESDFLKIRAGRYHYDLGAGLLQAMRLVYRTSADLARTARGDKPERGKSVVDVSGRYLRSKLAPAPSWFVDAVERRTYTGTPYSTAEAIRDRALPIMWNDWLEAGWEDGIGGVLKVSPGIVGIGVTAYDDKPKSQRSKP